jgi:hypothetical protein
MTGKMNTRRQRLADNETQGISNGGSSPSRSRISTSISPNGIGLTIFSSTWKLKKRHKKVKDTHDDRNGPSQDHQPGRPQRDVIKDRRGKKKQTRSTLPFIQPTVVIANILSYLVHQIGDHNGPRYVNKQWFTACMRIPNAIVQWLTDSSLERYYSQQYGDYEDDNETSFQVAIKQFPHVTSFIGFPLHEVGSLIKDPKFSVTLSSLRSISLTWNPDSGTDIYQHHNDSSLTVF